MIDILANTAKKTWNQYAAKNIAAKYSHLFDWGDSLAKVYSLPILRLAAINTQTNRISGILPLVLFDPPGKEKRLISLPYTDAAGIVADDWESGRRLLYTALEFADKLEANHLELRQDATLQPFIQQEKTIDTWSYTPHNFKTELLRPLPKSVDTLWSELSAKVRNQVRKARRCECIVKVGGVELLTDFYAVFSENMRDLGSPVHGLELFRSIVRSEAPRSAIIIIYLHGKPAAAAVVLLHNGVLCNPWASSLRIYRPSCPNMLLYWSMLEYAVDHGCNWFDFGRSSPDAPTCRFKLKWGAGMEPLVWYVFSRKPHDWDPRSESLEYDNWKSFDLRRSRRDGPAIRRWISL
ncbi:MAG: GNAT family N-acetyltransferase [Desulforhopalus sp.]